MATAPKWFEGPVMPTVDGRTIDYQETGEGPAVLFLPGSFSTPAAWRAVQNHLPHGYRFVGTSLCGYGGTAETRTRDDPGMAHQVRIVETVAKHIAAPVHLVGHSFGGAVALASALAGTIDILSIATFEASPIFLLRDHRRPDLLAELRRMSDAFEIAHDAGEPEAAKRVIDFWGGAGSFDAMPDAVKDYCRTTTSSNVLDWRTGYTFEASAVDYAQLDIPVLLVRGARANPAMVNITETLIANLPDVRMAAVNGASHFLITTHAEDCARLLADFLADF